MVAAADGSGVLVGTKSVQTEESGYFSVEVVRPADGFIPLQVTRQDGLVLVEGTVEVAEDDVEVDLCGCLGEVETFNGRPSYVSAVVCPGAEEYDHSAIEEHLTEASLPERDLPLFVFLSSWVALAAGESVSVSCYPHTVYDTETYGDTVFALASRVQARGGSAPVVSDVVTSIAPQQAAVFCMNQGDEDLEVRVTVLAAPYTSVFR